MFYSRLYVLPRPVNDSYPLYDIDFDVCARDYLWIVFQSRHTLWQGSSPDMRDRVNCVKRSWRDGVSGGNVERVIPCVSDLSSIISRLLNCHRYNAHQAVRHVRWACRSKKANPRRRTPCVVQTRAIYRWRFLKGQMQSFLSQYQMVSEQQLMWWFSIKMVNQK